MTVAMVAPVGFSGTISCTGGVPPLSGNTYTPDSDGLIQADPADVPTLLRSGFSLSSGASTGVNRSITALATVGADTFTAASVIAGFILRSGSVAAFTDTMPTAALLIAALVNPAIGLSWVLEVKNTTAFPETIATAAGITLSGEVVVAPLSVGRFLMTVTGAAAMTAVGYGSIPIATLPASQYVTAALQSTTMTGPQVAGANECNFDNTGTTPANLQMPTAAAIVAAIPNAQVGQSYKLNIRNSSSGANTATITTNTGVTLTGTMTIAQNVTRSFVVTLTSLTTVTVQSMGISAAGL